MLVADDNSSNQRLLQLLLEPIGFHVDTVANGEEAVTAARERAYDAIIMDCEMPVMDGYAATREIRNREGDRWGSPIVAVTASAMDRDVKRALAAGMDAHISKPIDREVLQTTLARLLPDRSDRSDPAGRADRAGRPRDPREAAPRPTATCAGVRVPEILDGDTVDTLLGLDDGDAFRQLTDRFVHDAVSRAEALETAAAAEDLDGLREAAHSLRGLSATFGATHVAELAATIEAAASAQETPGTRVLAAMIAAVADARDAYATIVAAIGSGTPDEPT